MILRKFIKHVKDQSWFAVGLDVIVVIVGIFLGLQVQNWYEDRNSKDEEQRVLGYLISDMERTIDFMGTRISSSERQITLTFKMLEILERGTLAQEDVPDFEEGIIRLGRGEQLDPFMNSFYDQNLNSILNGDMRKLIDDYRGLIRRDNGIIETTKGRIENARSVTDLATPIQRTLETEILVFYDFDQLKNNNEYRATLMAINGYVGSTLTRFKRARENSEIMIDALKDYQSSGTVSDVEFERASPTAPPQSSLSTISGSEGETP